MDIHLDYGPGDRCWVMDGSDPREMTIDYAQIYVGPDHNGRLKIDVKYHLPGAFFCKEARAEYMCRTKEELKEKVFGK